MALQKSSSSSFLLPLCLLLALQLLLWLTKTSAQSYAKPGCQEYCGDVRIPYPFGIGPNCYLDEWFSIECKNSISSYLVNLDLEVLEISLNGNYLRVNNPVISPNCHINNNLNNANSNLSIDLRTSPFLFSEINNIFMATRISSAQYLQGYMVDFRNQTSCMYAFVVDKNKNSTDYSSAVQTHVPAVLNWIVHNITQLRLAPDNSYKNSYSCFQRSLANSSIISEPFSTFLLHDCGVVQNLQCVCNFPFSGNPYLSNGCRGLKSFNSDSGGGGDVASGWGRDG
ncbi:wall-associated receptor kinase-like 8 [Camellia sinensis]|uniref:wall-associated receptor kinase-like 8 n=1 Tax=Camellia sinensis TaxID=4442 RepID=UPI001035E028|nr:wall-associated receptor kinase-like 8 [Camellia sinensis]